MKIEEAYRIFENKLDGVIKPKSVINVMMIIAFVFEQMFCHFEGAMGFHCNR